MTGEISCFGGGEVEICCFLAGERCIMGNHYMFISLCARMTADINNYARKVLFLTTDDETCCQLAILHYLDSK